MDRDIVLLGDEHREAVWSLGRLAFGGDPAAEPPPASPGSVTYGIEDGTGGLLASATVRAYEQWWGGRRVPMGGVASVAVHPDARGRGVARRLLRSLLPVMLEAGQAVSVLFPTAVGLYRPLGWEVVGSLDHTLLPTALLQGAGDPVGVHVRTAGPDDVGAVHDLYGWYGATSAGLLTREGPSFPDGPSGVLGHDVVALAEDEDGTPLGYASYDRGRGYGPDASLTVWEVVARTGEAGAALLRSLGSWDAVCPTVSWRGPTEELALELTGQVPPPHRVQPWMLRVVDAEAAVAARGFAPAATVDASFALVDPDVPGHDGAWRLVVAEGRGELERTRRSVDLPLLHVRGLALLYAGAADTGTLLRTGLLDRPMPTLDAAFAGPRPRVLDYF
jgi:predicted acetyltransferase